MKIIIFNLLLAITIIDGYKVLLIKKRSTGQASLTDDNGHFWYGTISVGAPSKDFTVMIDTGSSDIILPSTRCSINCDGHTLYDESQPPSSDAHKKATIQFDNGEEVTGDSYTNTISMAGLTVENQHLVSATSYPPSLATSQFPVDGILGLGFQELSQIQERPFFQSLYSNGVLDAAVFGLSLKKTGASLFLGGTDLDVYKGEVTYSPITNEGFWQIGVNSVKVSSTVAVSDLNAIIDSGTTAILTDPQTADVIYSNVPGAKLSGSLPGMYTVPCDSIPSISITISGRDFLIDPTLFNLGQIEEGSSDCVGALMGSGNSPNVLILGGVFLQNVYSIFDVGESRIGFADLV